MGCRYRLHPCRYTVKGREISQKTPWLRQWTWLNGCTCPYRRQPLGQVSGISTALEWCGGDMGRTATTPDCPIHDACQHYDGKPGPSGVPPWCPIHEAKGCPEPSAVADSPTSRSCDSASSDPASGAS